MPTLTKLYDLKEAGEHNTRDDCWVVVDGKVYDVSSYLDEHPGGDDVLLRATGKDATDEFNDAGHSKDAIQLMEEFCIGELDPSDTPEEESSSDKKADLTKKFRDMTLQYWAIPVGILGISVIACLFFMRRK
ncbi:cytochrome b5 [Thalictrum thalictroides]|uniref:Cytochrome b5 n=1 Tax=Thalictrum thalictroides TaxID=46969 RepID=A0A7J6V1X4_THATH|nr:cytochrome b5 [Thalictrum thalictroides]